MSDTHWSAIWRQDAQVWNRMDRSDRLMEEYDKLMDRALKLEAENAKLQAAFDYAYQVATAYCPECQDKLDALEGGE